MKLLRPIISRVLDWYLASLPEKTPQERLALLRKLLPQHPYWLSGHLLYAECALELGDLQSAYPSIIAAEQLSGGAVRHRFRIERLYTAAALFQQDFERAEVHAERALELQPTDAAAKEDLVAVRFGQGRFEEVERLLAEMGKGRSGDRLTGVAQYARRRLSGEP